MHKNLSLLPISILLYLVTVSGCTFQQLQPSQHSVQHVVLAWAKPGTPDSTIDRIIKETRELQKIPGIERLYVGRAIPSERKIVDSSYDIGIVMSFPDVETMNRYINHPQHVDFVNRYVKPHVNRIIVYDIQD